jgi:hypothetical protein
LDEPGRRTLPGHRVEHSPAITGSTTTPNLTRSPTTPPRLREWNIFQLSLYPPRARGRTDQSYRRREIPPCEPTGRTSCLADASPFFDDHQPFGLRCASLSSSTAPRLLRRATRPFASHSKRQAAAKVHSVNRLHETITTQLQLQSGNKAGRFGPGGDLVELVRP